MRKESLGTLTKIVTGKLDVNAGDTDGEYPFFTCAIKPHRINTFAFDTEAVLVAGNGDLNVKYYSGKFNAYQRTYVIRKKQSAELSMRYLYYFIESYMEKLRSGAIGGIIKYIKLGHLTDAQIPLPPLEDQKRIASILTRVEKLIARRKENIQLLDELLKSTFLEMFGDPVRNEKGWEKKQFSSSIESLRNGMSPSRGGDFPGKVYTLSAITGEDFRIIFKDDFFSKEIDTKFYANSNDFLICRGNGNINLVGRGQFIVPTNNQISFPDTMIAARVITKKINRNFITSLWKTKFIRSQIENEARTANGTFKINQKAINSIDIIIPPIELQNKFASIAEKVESIKSSFLKSLTELENLYGSLSQKAFKGKLDLSRISLPEEDETEATKNKTSQIQAFQAKDEPEVKIEKKAFKTLATVALTAGGVYLAKKLFENITRKDEQIEDFILTESYLSEIIPKTVLLKMFDDVEGRFSFIDLWGKTRESIISEMPEHVSLSSGWEDVLYLHIKSELFNLLEEKKLSQFFDKEKKEMLLSVNR